MGIVLSQLSTLRGKKKENISFPASVYKTLSKFSSGHSLSCVRFFADPMDCSTPGFPVHHQLQSLLKLMSMELVVAFSQLFLCCSLLLLPSIFPSIRVFSKESQFFALGGQSIGASTSAVNIQD